MKAIIFDLDGTLCYTKNIKDIVNIVLKHFGKTYNKKEAEKFWFMHNRDKRIDSLGIDTKEFWKTFHTREVFMARIQNTHFFKDIDSLLVLHKKGIKLALLTGSSHEISCKILGRYKELFETIVWADPIGDAASKPSPEGVNVCLKKLKTTIKETIYVGNSDEDIRTAMNAGIFSVLIDRKEHAHKLKPDAKIESLFELEKFV